MRTAGGLKWRDHAARDGAAVHTEDDGSQEGKEQARPLPQGDIRIDGLAEREKKLREVRPGGRRKRLA